MKGRDVVTIPFVDHPQQEGIIAHWTGRLSLPIGTSTRRRTAFLWLQDGNRGGSVQQKQQRAKGRDPFTTGTLHAKQVIAVAETHRMAEQMREMISLLVEAA